jgi:hypothetical protein
LAVNQAPDRNFSALFSQKIEHQGQDEAEENAGSNGKVKIEVPTLDVDVARKPAQPQEREQIRVDHNQAENNEQQTENDKKASERWHCPAILTSSMRIHPAALTEKQVHQLQASTWLKK